MSIAGSFFADSADAGDNTSGSVGSATAGISFIPASPEFGSGT